MPTINPNVLIKSTVFPITLKAAIVKSWYFTNPIVTIIENNITGIRFITKALISTFNINPDIKIPNGIVVTPAKIPFRNNLKSSNLIMLIATGIVNDIIVPNVDARTTPLRKPISSLLAIEILAVNPPKSGAKIDPIKTDGSRCKISERGIKIGTINLAINGDKL